ncbi:MAG TPA: HAMP domain-containing protein [Gaiellaceae bacterium]|nr:HAMP domain-containing protein [Gaiellaceae bacterium]
MAVDEHQQAEEKTPADGRARARRRARTGDGAGDQVTVDRDTLERLLVALRAAREGDLGARVTTRSRGIERDLADAFNELAVLRERTTKELVRVGKAVGRDGRLGERAQVAGARGTWADSIDAVNGMVDDLVRPTTEVARVIEAVARGDLSQRIALRIEGQPIRGEFLRMGTIVNAMVDQLSTFADEVTRVAREVGTDGKLGGQARVRNASGVWKDLTDNVNTLAGNLTSQVRNIAQVTTAVARGDLSKKISVDAKGEVAELKDTINTMVDQLSSFADEVTRVAREVGTEGKLGGQAQVRGVSGVWKDLTENVNTLAGNLTSQVRNIATVTTAVAGGDLSRKITVDAKGEVAELKDTINTMVDQLRSFAAEVTRVAREVGTEGKLGGQANVAGVSGTWRDLTESVNGMASNLTAQVRNIAQVTTAVAGGDLSQKITVDVRGEMLALKDTINTMVDQLSTFADEVTRVAREVGTEGKLGGQAQVRGVSGVWKDLTENVNTLAGNLTSQVRNIALVTTAVAKGDLSQKITVDARGEVLELKQTVNTMVDQLSTFADEVTRVAREVGTEGKLGGQARVTGVSGTWKDLTESVNGMASNLTAQVRNIAAVTTAVAGGDLSKKITVDVRGELLELKDTINTMVDQLRSFAAEVTRVAREVGSDGKLGGQAEVEGVSGTWKDLTDSVNFMASALTEQVRNIALVTTAVANGDLSRKITVDVKGEVLELKETINTMVDQLRAFAAEVTRVAREVGTEGKLGGQAQVAGVSGVWRDLTENVDQLAANLTTQVRAIANVTTAVARGDLSQKITVEAGGEIAELAATINRMVDQLSTFAGEVTRVAREVGTEGKLGGQATVEDVSGVWKNLTDNVNQLAATLTTQLRAIAEVSTAVTQGDLSREVTVEAQGEVEELRDNINRMIGNLRSTTQRTAEQDWLNSNLARFGGLLQGRRDLRSASRLIMSELTPLVGAQHGAFFVLEGEGDEAELRLLATYGYKERKTVANRFKPGEGLVGQAALERKPIVITQAPPDYVKVTSGLGEASPVNIVVMPVLFEDQVMAVIELGSLAPFTEVHQAFLEQLAETVGVVLNTIVATMRTEELLVQSQSLTRELQSQSEELQSQQEELQQTNQELEEQAASLKASEELLQQQQEELQQTNEELEERSALLEEQNQRIEQTNAEIEHARRALEEKAEQLALSSRYKSEFLANMSHELRTPLNSLLILAKLLADNPEQNLTDKQLEFAATIHSAGTDLLELINDILDLSKVEAGKMELSPADVPLDELRAYAERTFRPLAEQKGLRFDVEVADDVPTSVHTDEQRLQQVLKNLLSNALKFTDTGEVTLRVERAPHGVGYASSTLAEAEDVLAFAVSDTGIGIAEDKLRLIFEAFQQADGTTSRKYGGTGLGLSISREIARLLGGEIAVASEPGRGSTFTLFLPARLVEPERPQDDDGGPVTAFEAELVARASAPPPVDLDAALAAPAEVPDDRDEIEPGDRVVLIVEDDPDFAGIVLDVARERDFKGVVALRGDTALALAHDLRPDAIVLDLTLPVLDGHEVLEQLKRHPETRHIPVHVISGGDGRQDVLRAGAVAFIEKPATKELLEQTFGSITSFIDRPVRRLLVVDDDEAQRRAIAELVSGADVEIEGAGDADEALAALEERPPDCVVLDLKLPGKSGFELLEQVKRDERFRDLPIIVYTGKELTKREETRLRRYADTIVVKDVSSPERLLDETSLFLHRVESRLPRERRRMLEQLHGAEAVFEGRRVLIVDDDVRNVFALTSVLEGHGMEVRFAENGKEALEALRQDPEVDLVLMDIMMPELDGHETTRAIRERPQFERLPIIALTAKAMKGDRDRAIAAGASDYVTKPVDTDQLLSLMRVWLYR